METDRFVQSTFKSNARAWYGVWGVRLASILVWLIGGINVLAALLPGWMRQMKTITDFLPLVLETDNRLTLGLTGLVLFLLAANLWRHKQAAWLVVMLLLIIATVLHLFRNPGFATIPPILLLILFMSQVYSFHARSDPLSVYKGLSIIVSTFLVVFCSGVVGFLLDGINAHQPIGLLTAINHTMTLLVSFYDPSPQPIHSFCRYFASAIHITGFAAIGSTLLLLTRPVALRQPATAVERRQAAEIVDKYGRSIISTMMLFKDKHYFFSPGGSVIAYGVSGRGALALGGPIGPIDDTAAAISAFKAYCARNDWQPYFIYVPAEGLEHYRSNGLKSLCVAYEGRIPLASFSLEGHENQDVRHHYKKNARLGYQARLYAPPLEDRLLRELRQVSDEWLSAQYGGEKYFLVGCFSDEYIRNSTVMAVHAPDGKVVAFSNLVFSDHNTLVSADLVRSRANVENGMMEFLIVSMMNWAISIGYETFSLSAVMAVGRGIEPNDPPIAKAIQAFSTLIDRLYKFNGLYIFKNKFHPRWEPYFIVYPGVTALAPAFLTMLWLYTHKSPA
jgi:phosphatidylglycerol lysyltransferase